MTPGDPLSTQEREACDREAVARGFGEKERLGFRAGFVAGCRFSSRPEYEQALRILADPENWLGDPHDQSSTLHGHFTPFELAVASLSGENEQP
jgi:hypothetical protein